MQGAGDENPFAEVDEVEQLEIGADGDDENGDGDAGADAQEHIIKVHSEPMTTVGIFSLEVPRTRLRDSAHVTKVTLAEITEYQDGLPAATATMPVRDSTRQRRDRSPRPC